MISMTKLYDYLNTSFFLIATLVLLTSTAIVLVDHFETKKVLRSNQELSLKIVSLEQSMYQDLNHYGKQVLKSVDTINEIQYRVDQMYISDSLTWSITIEKNISPVNLIHYFAEVEICSEDYPSYKVKIDFYWINPRIEDGKLMVLSEHFTADYHEYFPIFDKNIGYDANLCGLKLLNK